MRYSLRPGSRRRGSVLAGVLAVLLVVGVLVIGRYAGPASSELPEPFAPSSSWRTPVSPDPALDPNSAAMIAGVQTPPAFYASMLEFGIPIYQAGPDTPRYTVTCSETNWGPCPFDGIEVPVPDGARPHTGSDGAMVVVDEGSGLSYEFWQARQENGSWTTTFGAINEVAGSGWGGAATGSGASRLAGVVRLDEVARGDIPHALALQTDNVCAGAVRPPALKTDGSSTRPDCLPEGARLQLDPALDLDSLNLTPAERMIATAMQRYGGYIVDVGGTALSFSLQLDPQAGGENIGQIYQDAGFRWDYDALDGVPWDRLRVLQ